MLKEVHRILNQAPEADKKAFNQNNVEVNRWQGSDNVYEKTLLKLLD